MALSKRPAFSSFSASCLTLTGLILATPVPTWSPGRAARGANRRPRSEQPPLCPLEGAAVDCGRPQAPEGEPVVFAPVAHVVGQTVTGMAEVPLPHDTVPGHLGHDGGGGDG